MSDEEREHRLALLEDSLRFYARFVCQQLRLDDEALAQVLRGLADWYDPEPIDFTVAPLKSKADMFGLTPADYAEVG